MARTAVAHDYFSDEDPTLVRREAAAISRDERHDSGERPIAQHPAKRRSPSFPALDPLPRETTWMLAQYLSDAARDRIDAVYRSLTELAPHELLGALPDADAATLRYARDVLLASFDPERLPSCAGPTRRKLEIIVACVNEAYEMITEGQAAVRAAPGASRA